MASRLRELWDRHLPRVTVWILFALLILFTVGSVAPDVGNWIESVRFGGAALLVGVALLFLDVITTERKSDADARSFDDSLRLGPVFACAAARRDIRIDFAGDSAETFKILLRDTLRAMEGAPGLRRKTLAVRVLVPDLTSAIAVPCNMDLVDDAIYRDENWKRTRASLSHIESELQEFCLSNGVKFVSFEVRFHHLTPTVKLYVLNDSVACWAIYRIETRPRLDDRNLLVWDTRGTNAPVFVTSANGDVVSQRQFIVLSGWFRGIWDSVAYPLPTHPVRTWTGDGQNTATETLEV